MKFFPERLAPYGVLIALFAAAILYRPILPIDETRYMSVAWEMFLQKQYAVLSLNFAPYHHKPPLLFWLINGAWHIFGVSRWSALIPVFVASATVLTLSRTLAGRLFPAQTDIAALVPWVMVGSVPFLIYGTMLMFDLMVAALLLAFLIIIVDYSRKGCAWRVVAAGLILGLGILAKGPVMYLYAVLPLLFYTYWRGEDSITPRRLYKALGLIILVSAIPVLAWLIPALSQTNGNFAFWLIWEQTAGRIAGNFGAAHSRPIYFYLMVLPIMVLPWALSRPFWHGIRHLTWQAPGMRFIAAATIPAFVAFSVIAGKQPHYLVPLLPFVMIVVAGTLDTVRPAIIRTVSVLMAVAVIGGQVLAANGPLKAFDLQPLAPFYQAHEQADWVYVRNYQGELGYLARIQKPMDSVDDIGRLPAWFDAHPGGMAIIGYNDKTDMSGYREIYSQPYKSRRVGIFTRENH